MNMVTLEGARNQGKWELCMDVSHRLSSYNLVVQKKNDKVILTNTITKAIIEIDRSVFKHLINENFADIPPEQLKDFNRLGFIVQPNLDEFLYLKYQHYSTRFDQDIPSIHICPTLDCNFSCPYCFESPDFSGLMMSDETADSIIRYFENRAEKWKAIGVRWFGGEPLLAFSRIRDLSERIISICSQNDIFYQATMATNGYLLDKEKLKVLKNYRVFKLQITLDGIPDVHNSRRFERNSKSTFKRILENIILSTQMDFKVVVRINIDKETYPSFGELLDILDSRIEKKDQIEIFTWPTNDCGYRELDIHTSATLYTFKEYASVLEPEIIRLVTTHGFLMYNHRTELHFRCPLYNIGSFYMDPLGHVYNCGFYLGIKAHAYGKLLPDGRIKIINLEKNLEPFKYDAFNTKECRNCKILPYCFGKCPVVWESNARGQKDGCVAEKFTLRDRLLNIIKVNKMRKENATIKTPV
jgi:uncharacterized protein